MINNIKLYDCVKNKVEEDFLNLNEKGDDYFDDDFELKKNVFLFQVIFMTKLILLNIKISKK